MDPYYQQQQQQQLQQQQGGQLPPSRGVPQAIDPNTGMVSASAPPLQQSQQHQQQPQMQPQQHQSGHSRSSYSQQPHQSSHHSSSHQQSSQQQQQQLQQQQAYLEQQQAAGYVGQQPQHLSQTSNGRHQHQHHGGQAPLPPAHQTSGRGYGGGSHRQAIMHQHRSSAAAISDPMMASTITDHLASSSGPMTGSGSALNQLGASGGYIGGGVVGSSYPYHQSAGGVVEQHQQHQPGAYGGHHQSRYDTHFSANPSTRGSRGQHQYSGGYLGQQQALGATTAGAYHLDRDLFQTSELNRANYPYQGLGGNAPLQAQTGGSLHQSLGNLPSATSARMLTDRYGDPLQQQHQMQPDRYYMTDGGMAWYGRAGSMPPVGATGGTILDGTTGATTTTTSIGLGSYNPLDDPLMVGGGANVHSREGIQFGPNPYGAGGLSTQQGAVPLGPGGPNSRDVYITELRARLLEAQNSYAAVKRELETATQKLGSSMHSIKSFWSPELKKERALRKEEATKYALINDQMKLMRVEVQKQALLIRQLEEELRLAHETRIRTQEPDIQQHIDALCMEKEALFKENCLFRDTIRELEMRLETQKQTLAARDDSIKKMVEMMNNKGIATKIMEDERMEMDRIKTRNIELEARIRHYETILESKEKDILKNSQISLSNNNLLLSNSNFNLLSMTEKQKVANISLNKNDNNLDRVENKTSEQNSPIPRMRKSTRKSQPNQQVPRAQPEVAGSLHGSCSFSPPPLVLLQSSAAAIKPPQQQQQQQQLPHPISKIERLKNRLYKNRSPSNEKLNDSTITRSNSSSSSSSGVSSSKSSEQHQQECCPNTNNSEIVQKQQQHLKQLTQNMNDNNYYSTNYYYYKEPKFNRPPTSTNSNSLEHATNQEKIPPPSKSSICSMNEKIFRDENYFKLCQCADCRTSGQEIYSLNNSSSLESQRSSQKLNHPASSRYSSNNIDNNDDNSNSILRQLQRPPTPPKVAPRKAVSFRSNVEQIGSPSLKPLNDQKNHIQNSENLLLMPSTSTGSDLNHHHQQQLLLQQKQTDNIKNFKQMLDEKARTNNNFPEDSCDSLHVTKDFSNINSSLAFDDDYLRPLDCSTPKMNYFDSNSIETNVSHGERENLIQVEVHKQPQTTKQQLATIQEQNQLITSEIAKQISNTYTCLCSPDFNCIHNYPAKQAHLLQLQPAVTQAKSILIDNELYGQQNEQRQQLQHSLETTTTDFPLSKDCDECLNLSTYVNLSLSQQQQQHMAGKSGVRKQNDNKQCEPSLMSNITSNNNNNLSKTSSLNGSNNNGYGSQEYRQLLLQNKQNDVYGTSSSKSRTSSNILNSYNDDYKQLPRSMAFNQSKDFLSTPQALAQIQAQSQFDPMQMINLGPKVVPPSLYSSTQEGESQFLQLQQQLRKQNLSMMTEEQMHFMSAARQIQQTIADCGLCKEQFLSQQQQPPLIGSLSSSSFNNNNNNQHLMSLPCKCQPQQNPDQANPIQAPPLPPPQAPVDLSMTLSSKSYHTASSSLMEPNYALYGNNNSNSAELINRMNNSNEKSELSVLPLNVSCNNVSKASDNLNSRISNHNQVLSMDSLLLPPLSESNKQHLQQQQQQSLQQQSSFMDTNANAANIDSSLSSLFVYRHISDDNQDFDPDSLEIAGTSAPTKTTATNPFIGNNKIVTKQASNNQAANNNNNNRAAVASSSSSLSSNANGWLKPRSKSEYIYLSSTTSSGSGNPKSSNANKASNKNKFNNTELNNNSNKSNSACSSSGKPNGLMMQVGSDITQSSLARRRLNNNQLQNVNNNSDNNNQKQTNASASEPGPLATTSNKRKLLASKLNFRSSPNVSQKSQHQEVSGSNKPSGSNSSGKASCSRSNSSSNVRNLYQSFKNHFLDITTSTSSANNSSHTSVNPKSSSNPKISTKQQASSSASLPGNLSSRFITNSSSSTLPNNSSNKAKLIHQMEELRTELAKRDQELLTMGAKMKALEDQQRDSQRHIRVLKDSLVAKEEHYNLLVADMEEMRRNLDERNKALEKKSYTFQQHQQAVANNMALAMGANNMDSSRLLSKVGTNMSINHQELQELQNILESKERKINELQRKVLQLDSLLNEREAQLERARMRLEHTTSVSGGAMAGSNQPDYALLNHLEETLGDKEKQISILKDQRDRVDNELKEERILHEKSIKEYKMKLNSLRFEMEKLQNRLSNKPSKALDEFGISSSSFGMNDRDQTTQIKRLELDNRALQLECDRLKDKLDNLASSSRLLGRTTSDRAGANLIGSSDRASSALGDYSIVEFERLQENLESYKQELRRAQAECRMNEMERKRAQEEADKLSERYERSQSDMHKLKAKLENAISEREQLIEECDRQQQLINKSQTERDSALADINQIKLENERMREISNKNQLQLERLQAQLERSQLELKKCETRLQETLDELRQIQTDRSTNQRELKAMEINLQTAQLQQQRLQQDKELSRNELEKIREKYDRLEQEMERYLRDKELNSSQLTMFKERNEQQLLQLTKLTKERDQLSMEIHELRERLHKQQKLQDTSEHETRNEMRLYKEKYERLLLQFEKLQEDIQNKTKENQMVMEKLQRFQSETVKLEAKLEQSEMDRERVCIEVEKLQQLNNKSKDEYKRWQDEIEQLQEMYTKTNTKLLKLSEVEEKLRIDYDKCQMDLEVLRERYEKLQLEFRKVSTERDRFRIDFERQQQQQQFQSEQQTQQQGLQQTKTQDDFQRLSNELERSITKLDQYQREINKLQLEKERLILDSKSNIQQVEQQYQQQLLKLKTNEEKLLIELDGTRLQLEKVQAKYDQLTKDQEKLFTTKENVQQQLLLLQQEVDKFRNQQSSSVQETKKMHDDEMQRVLQELETIREKYTQQRKELLQLRELQQNHEIDKDILKRELESAEARLEKLNQADNKQKQDFERCMIEIEKLKDKIERKQQELLRTQKERNQFAQEITVLHQQIQQLQLAVEQQQQQQQQQQQTQATSGQPQQQQQQAQNNQQQQVKMEEINKLKQMLVKSENDLQKTMAENQRFQMEVERLKLQLDDAAEYIGKIENDNKMLQKQNQELIQQLKQQANNQQQQQQQKQQQQPNQQAELERAQQEMKKMQDVIKKSANEIQKMVEERNKLQEINKELQRQMEQTKTEFNSTMDQYETELQRLQQENQKQQQQQQPAQQQQQQAPSDEYKIKFEKAVEAIRAFQKSSDDMKKEITKLNDRNKSLSEQNQNLIQTLKLAEDSLQKQQQTSGDNSNKQDVGNQSKDGQEMRQQLIQLSELCAKLEKDLNKSNEETQQHKQSNQQMKQTLDKMQNELNNSRTERDRFQAQLEKLMVELERREDEMANLQMQQDKSGQNLQSKQNELVSYQKQLEEREKVLEIRREELQNLSKQLQQQQQQQQQKQGQPQEGGNQQQVQQLEQTVAKLQQQIKVLEDEKAKLKGELERVRNELKQSQAELERLLKILSAGEEDKFNLTQQIEQLQAKIKQMQQSPSPSQQQQQHPQQQHPQQQQQQQFGNRGPQQQAVEPGQRAPPPVPPQQQQQQPARGGPQAQQGPQQQHAQQLRPGPQPAQQQQQKPANQGQAPNETLNENPIKGKENSNLSLLENMELLEAAMKRSINWSIKNRKKQHVADKSFPKINDDNCPIEKMNQKLQDQSHVRAFITHFKIELNNLMDSRRNGKESSDNNESDSLSDELDSDVEEILKAVKQYEATNNNTNANDNKKTTPLIKINGKHFGLYNIDVSERQLQLNGLDDNNQAEQHSNSNYYSDDVDDGYRSLSRNSFKTNLIQQLNDIKSRLIDLLHEIDHLIGSNLNKEDVEAYTKRRKALVSKLDLLIDSNLEKLDEKSSSQNKSRTSSSIAINGFDDDVDYGQQTTITNVDCYNVKKRSPLSTSSATSSSSRTNSLKRQKSKSYSSLLKTNKQIRQGPTDKVEGNSINIGCEYEEQVHVIDYDFGRRASDSNSSDDNAKFQYFDAKQQQQPLIVSSTRIKSQTNPMKKPIDFGAMMKNYEQQTTTKSLDNNNAGPQAACYQPMLIRNQASQHVASNSSTSNYSASSHTSSSSYL